MFGAVRARTLEGPGPSRASAGRATTARGAAYVPCRAALPTVSRGELHVPQVSVKPRLAPVLLLLQQRPHPASAVTAERGRGVADGELDERHRVRPVVAPVPGEGAQDVGDDAATDALGLAGQCWLRCGGAASRRSAARPARLVQARPEGAREARAAVPDERAGQAAAAAAGVPPLRQGTQPGSTV